MTEHHGLTRAPILEVDRGSVFGRESVHCATSPLVSESSVSPEQGAGQRLTSAFAQKIVVSRGEPHLARVEIDTATVDELRSDRRQICLKNPLCLDRSDSWHHWPALVQIRERHVLNSSASVD